MKSKTYFQVRIRKFIAGITGVMFLFNMISCGSVDTTLLSSSNAVSLITSLTLKEVSGDSITLDWDLFKIKEGIIDPTMTYTVHAEAHAGGGAFTNVPDTETVYTIGSSVDLGEGRSSTVLPVIGMRAAGIKIGNLVNNTPYRIVVEAKSASGNTSQAHVLAYTASLLVDPGISGIEATTFIDSEQVDVAWKPKEEAQFYLIQASEEGSQLEETVSIDNILMVVCPPGSLLCERPNQFAEPLGDGELGYFFKVNKKAGRYKLVIVPFNFHDLQGLQAVDEEGRMSTFTEEVLTQVEDVDSVLSQRLRDTLKDPAKVKEIQIKVSIAEAPTDLVLDSTGSTLSASWGHGIGAEYYYATLIGGEVTITNIIDRYEASGKFAGRGYTSFDNLKPETPYTVLVQSLTVINNVTNEGGYVSAEQFTKDAGDKLNPPNRVTGDDLILINSEAEKLRIVWNTPEENSVIGYNVFYWIGDAPSKPQYTTGKGETDLVFTVRPGSYKVRVDVLSGYTEGVVGGGSKAIVIYGKPLAPRGLDVVFAQGVLTNISDKLYTIGYPLTYAEAGTSVEAGGPVEDIKYHYRYRVEGGDWIGYHEITDTAIVFLQVNDLSDPVVIEAGYGKKYQVEVVVSNAGGFVSDVGAIEFIYYSLPTIVSDISQAPSTVGELTFSEHVDGSFQVTWTKPDGAGRDKSNTPAQLVGYRVSWGTTAEADEGSTNIDDPDTLSHTITGLDPGTQYYVKVQAKNDNEEGRIYNDGSTGSTYTTKEPGTVSFIAYSEHTTDGFKVNWDTVMDAGYSPEGPFASVGYSLELSSNQGGTWQSVTRSDYSATEETLTDLISGTSYQIKVVATNEASLAGPAGEGVETWTLSLPGPVGGLVVSDPKEGGFKVSWTAPLDTGRTPTGDFAAIAGYEVTYAEVNGESTYSVSLEATRTEYTFTGLNAKQKYDILVQARTENGIGSENQVFGWVSSLPGAVPSDSIVFSQPTSHTIQITWDAPEPGRAGGSSSGNAPTWYKVEIVSEEAKGNENAYSLVQDNHSTNVITVTGLVKTTAYRARITAKNIYGEAPFSVSTSTGTTLDSAPTPPSAVRNLKVQVFIDRQVVLSWTAPSDPGTIDGANPAALSGYVVKYKRPSDEKFIEIDKNSEGVQLTGVLMNTSTTATVTGLSGNTQYTFLVAASNSGSATTPDGDAARVEKTTGVFPPQNLAKQLNSCNKSDGVDLTWDASAGATYYKLHEIREHARYGKEIGGKITGTSFSSTGLRHSSSYIYKVRACNDAGCSAESEPLKITTLKDKNLRVLINSGEVPADIYNYDQKSYEIFFHYKTGASIEARYVKEGGRGRGTSYEKASGNLTEVMELIQGREDKIVVVFVDGGTYNITKTFHMLHYVAIVGGVNGCLDFVDKPTILDGGGVRQVIQNGLRLTRNSLLYGVTIANGKAEYGGGGVWNSTSSPTFMWVTFTGNKSDRNGGAMENLEASPVLIGVTFSGNKAGWQGDAIYNIRSSPVLIGVNLLDDMANDSDGKGEGPLVVNSILRGGRGFMKNDDSSPDSLFRERDSSWRDEAGVERFRVYNSAVSTGNLESEKKYYSYIDQGWFLSLKEGGVAPVVISFTNNIATDPQLGALGYYGGSVLTHSIPKNSPAVNKGLYVRWAKNGTFYYSVYSKDYGNWWYRNPQLTGTGISVPVTLNITAHDATGYIRTGRPDLGTYEAR